MHISFLMSQMRFANVIVVLAIKSLHGQYNLSRTVVSVAKTGKQSKLFALPSYIYL